MVSYPWIYFRNDGSTAYAFSNHSPDFSGWPMSLHSVCVFCGSRSGSDPAYAEALAELDERIEGEARARLQALDDRRALRRAGVRSVDDLSDEDWGDDFLDEEDGPEIIYVRD